MFTLNEVKQICRQLSLEDTGAADDNLSEDISCIVYRIDVIDCDTTVIIDRHVDIEYSYGDYYEVSEDTPLFQFIGTLCELPLLDTEQEIILYQE